MKDSIGCCHDYKLGIVYVMSIDKLVYSANSISYKKWSVQSQLIILEIFKGLDPLTAYDGYIKQLGLLM